MFWPSVYNIKRFQAKWRLKKSKIPFTQNVMEISSGSNKTLKMLFHIILAKKCDKIPKNSEMSVNSQTNAHFRFVVYFIYITYEQHK